MKISILFTVIIGLSLYSMAFGQEKWHKIQPLVSKCKDVKKLLEISECNFPYTEWKSTNYGLTISFPRNDDELRVSKDTVIHMVVLFKVLPKLSDIEQDLSGYTARPEYDAPEITIYENKKKGITLSVQTPPYVKEPYVWSLSLGPSEEALSKSKNKKQNKGP